MRPRLVAVVSSLLTAAASAVAGSGQGLSIDADRFAWPQFQARLQMATEPLNPLLASFEGASLRPRSAALFGDYYVTRPYIGQAGGLRVTSGLVSGTRGAVIGPGQATPPGAFGFSTQARSSLGSAPIDAAGDTETWPYLGIGYSDTSLRGGWGFSADLGLAAQSFGMSRAARSLSSLSLDDMVRDMRLTPVLQLGVSYRF
ncbi:MAG TPA: hypothetical protein VI032_10150 [Burkholderiaceae bacterium]